MPVKRTKSRAIARRDKEITRLIKLLKDSEDRAYALWNGQRKQESEIQLLESVIVTLGRALFFSTQNKEARLTFSIAAGNIERAHGSNRAVARALQSLGNAAATYTEREYQESGGNEENT